MPIAYIVSNDELVLSFRPLKEKPTKELGRFKLWWDEEGNICGLDVMPLTEELAEFRRNLHTARLGGIWRGAEITDEDIKRTREDLLKKLEEKW